MGRANANGWPKFGECSTQISVRHDSVADPIAKAAGPRLSSGGLYRNVLTEAQRVRKTGPFRRTGRSGRQVQADGALCIARKIASVHGGNGSTSPVPARACLRAM